MVPVLLSRSLALRRLVWTKHQCAHWVIAFLRSSKCCPDVCGWACFSVLPESILVFHGDCTPPLALVYLHGLPGLSQALHSSQPSATCSTLLIGVQLWTASLFGTWVSLPILWALVASLDVSACQITSVSLCPWDTALQSAVIMGHTHTCCQVVREVSLAPIYPLYIFLTLSTGSCCQTPRYPA